MNKRFDNYGLVNTVAPTAEPVSVAEFKDSQRITHDDEDSLIGGYLMAARSYIEYVTRRRFVTQTYTLSLDEFPCDGEIVLPVSPVQSVTSITYTDAAGDSQTLSSSLYRVDIKSQQPRITPSYGNAWPVALPITGAVVVTFVAGYGAPSAVPMLAKRTITLLAAHWYENREPVVVGTSIAPLPLSIDALIQILHVGTYP